MLRGVVTVAQLRRIRRDTFSMPCVDYCAGHIEQSLSKVTLRLVVETPARPKSQGFKAWTEDDVSTYEQHWPPGMRQRVWLDVLLYTGLRPGRCRAAWTPACKARCCNTGDRENRHGGAASDSASFAADTRRRPMRRSHFHCR